MNRPSSTCTVCVAAAIGAFFLTMQSTHVSAQDMPDNVEVWVSELWEHKIEITVRFDFGFGDPASYNRAERLRTNLYEGSLPVVQQQASDEAAWACDLYGREAVGPINTRWDADTGEARLRTIQTFACAIP